MTRNSWRNTMGIWTRPWSSSVLHRVFTHPCWPETKAGLFSAVTSAFIIQVNPQLQPDPNEETAVLLCLLIYRMDNTFGNDAPTLPQSAGPPHTIIQVQAILFASLAISLFSAFLAMLGKQWLNCYESTNMWGSAIECSHNWQEKLSGMVAWCFNYVMELPLMLQVSLLLLGCTLSCYLWEVNITIASVVIGITSFGVIFYLFIVVAGTATKSVEICRVYTSLLLFVHVSRSAVYLLNCLSFCSSVHFFHLKSEYFFPQLI